MNPRLPDIRHAGRPVLLAMLATLAACGDFVSGPEPLADQKALSRLATERHYTVEFFYEGVTVVDGEPAHVFAETVISKFMPGRSVRLFTLPVAALQANPASQT